MRPGQWPENFILVWGTQAISVGVGLTQHPDLLQHVLPWLKLRCHLPIPLSVSVDSPGRIHPDLSVSQVTREIIVCGIKCLLIRNRSCSTGRAVAGVLCDFSASTNGHSQQPLHTPQEQTYSGMAAKEEGSNGVKRILMKRIIRNRYKTQKIEQKEKDS